MTENDGPNISRTSRVSQLLHTLTTMDYKSQTAALCYFVPPVESELPLCIMAGYGPGPASPWPGFC